MRSFRHYLSICLKGTAAGIIGIVLAQPVVNMLKPAPAMEPSPPMLCVPGTSIPHEKASDASIIELHRKGRLIDDTVMPRGVIVVTDPVRVCFKVDEQPYPDSFDRVGIDGTWYDIVGPIIIDGSDTWYRDH